MPSLQGRVVRASGRGMVSHVAVFAPDPGARTEITSAGSRADGSFEVYGLPQGRYRLYAILVSANGTRSHLAPSAAIAVESIPALEVLIRVPVGEDISGVVLDPAGSPVPALSLSAEGTAEDADPHTRAPGDVRPGVLSSQCSTDERGRFLFENMANASFRVTATRLPDKRVPWITGGESLRSGTRDAVLCATSPAAVRGTVVVRGGTVASGIRVVALRLPARELQYTANATTGEGGIFTLEGLDPDSRYEFAVVFEDGSASDPVILEPGQRRLVLEVSAAVEGSLLLVDEGGTPRVGLNVILRHVASEKWFVRTTDDRGVARLPYALTGEFSVELCRPYPRGNLPLGTVRSGVIGQVIKAEPDR